MNIYIDIILICLSIDINGLRTYTVQYISILYRAKNRSLTSKLEDPHIQNEEGPFFDSFKYNIPSQ